VDGPEAARRLLALTESHLTGEIRRISVIAPMLNEAEHVEQLARDIKAQDFDGDVELIVADGGSTDGSVEKLEQAARAVGLPLKVFPNPKQWAGPGLNICLRHANGDLIVRIDCHTHYPPDYLSRLVATSLKTGAWNVGGAFHAVGRTPMERAVACSYDSPFGGISWTRHRYREDPVDADIVYYGAFRPEVFERLGLYDEHLGTAELEDMCFRIRKAGGRVVYDPTVTLLYTPRGTFPALFRQYYRYGLWKVAAMRKHRRVLSGRSVVPFGFVISLAALGAASGRSPLARRLLRLELATYGAVVAASAEAAVHGRGESPKLLPRVAGSFVTCHHGYGLGQAHGWIRVARARGHLWPPEPRLPERRTTENNTGLT
jgi:succinoglycan biosynthesis protein ExoA